MVTVKTLKTVIPTYEIFDYDKNPMFLEKRVYQGSSGRVYPHPVCEGVSDVKSDKEYTAVYLENDYILVMILPELGGRIQRLLDKTNGYDAVYYNEVVKPALVGLAGPWISGGIEFNWPQHHRPSTFDPVDWTIEKHEDGSISVIVGETEKMFHTKGSASFTVYPDKAYLEIKGRVYNPTDRPQTFLWWANPAVSVNDYTRSVFPPDVNAVYDHGKRDVSNFPIATGVYYKVNYAPGTDISRYKNIPVPTSYMAHHSDYDFIGNYDESREAGLLHVADHHVSPGKKQWTWGNGDFGKAWDRNLTDENGPYIELMTGMFTDNQPDFTYLKPYEEKSFTQYFMPYQKAGAVKNANSDYAINLDPHYHAAWVTVYSTGDNTSKPVRLVLSKDGKTIYEEELALSATETFEAQIPTDYMAEELKLSLVRDGKEILSYERSLTEAEIPKPAKPMPEPSDVETNEDLYLNGMHLEQYRHATYNPADYYLEGLKRDPSDIRINNAYGRLLYKNGKFEESIPYFKAAIKKSTLRNPNPYDCEPFYNLGLALLMTGDRDGAFDAFYKASWDANMQDKAFYRLACIESSKGNFDKALFFVEESLVRGLHNLKARALKSALLRRLGRADEAILFNGETAKFDPLDIAKSYELTVLKKEKDLSYREIMRGDNADLIELALTYITAGLTDDAEKILADAFREDEPMINYYRYFITDDAKYLEKAEKASSLYCFPNRIEDINVLQKAVDKGGKMAAYYLGLIMYDKGNWQDSVRLWESMENDIKFPTVHRNLALAYFNKLKNPEKALSEMEEAFALDTTDSRVFFELDELYKELEKTSEFRLKNMRAHEELLELRDPLYTEFISLLNDRGAYKEAYTRIKKHIFHPWEGGEGKITAEYRRALISKALNEKDDAKASEILLSALTYPHNLGEGKLVGQKDNDIYYYLGERAIDKDKAKEYFELATRGEIVFTSAMYYNDQPPEMIYFIALSLNKLGKKKEAYDIFNLMAEYGKLHMDDVMKIDYFAVSLPDFLIFEGDLNKKNRKHCENMINLSKKGLKLISED